jgi:Restriction endonuclease BglII
MANHPFLPDDIAALYEVHEWRNGLAILSAVRREEWDDICEVLRGFRVRRSDILTPGGSKSTMAKDFDAALFDRGWAQKQFDTKIVVDGVETVSPTHEVDCFKGRVALEVEWNNKDPFFDRDLNNFRLLFDLRVIDVGVIVTRSTELQEVYKTLGRGQSAGASTTHMGKLLPKLFGGGAGGCPVVLFGIGKAVYVED